MSVQLMAECLAEAKALPELTTYSTTPDAIATIAAALYAERCRQAERPQQVAPQTMLVEGQQFDGVHYPPPVKASPKTYEMAQRATGQRQQLS